MKRVLIIAILGLIGSGVAQEFRNTQAAKVNSAGVVGIVPVPAYTSGVTYQPYAYTPPTIHYTGSGVGGIQAGLMNHMR